MKEIKPPELKLQDFVELNNVIKDLYDRIIDFVDKVVTLNRCIINQIQDPNSDFNTNLEEYVKAFRDSLTDLAVNFESIQNQLSNFSFQAEGWLTYLRNALSTGLTSWKNGILGAIPDFGAVPGLVPDLQYSKLCDFMANKDVSINIEFWSFIAEPDRAIAIVVILDDEHNTVLNAFGDLFKGVCEYIDDFSSIWSDVIGFWRGFWTALGDLLYRIFQALINNCPQEQGWGYGISNNKEIVEYAKYYPSNDNPNYWIRVKVSRPISEKPQVHVVPILWVKLREHLEDAWSAISALISNIMTALTNLRNELIARIVDITGVDGSNISYALEKFKEVLDSFASIVDINIDLLKTVRESLVEAINRLRVCLGLPQLPPVPPASSPGRGEGRNGSISEV